MMWCVLRGNWEYNDQKEVEMIKILMKDVIEYWEEAA